MESVNSKNLTILLCVLLIIIIFLITVVYLIALAHPPINFIGSVLENTHIIMSHDKAISIVLSGLDKNATYNEKSAFFSIGLSNTYIPIPMPAWIVHIDGVSSGMTIIAGYIQVNAITGNTKWIEEAC